MCAWEVRIVNVTISDSIGNTLKDMDIPGNDCPELAEKTADAIDDASLREIFVSTQKNNLDLCGKLGFQ